MQNDLKSKFHMVRSILSDTSFRAKPPPGLQPMAGGDAEREERGWVHVALGRGRRCQSTTGWRRCVLRVQVMLVVHLSFGYPARKLPFEGPSFKVGRGDLSSFTIRRGCDPGPEFQLKSLDGQGWLARIPDPTPGGGGRSATLTIK